VHVRRWFQRCKGPRGLAWAALCSLATIPLGQGGCGQDPAGAPPKPPQPIVIGVSLGLTGALDSLTGPLQNAIRVAEGQVNSLGGLFGRPVEFRIVDDAGDEATVVQKAVSGLIAQGAVVVIGPAGSQQVVATQKLAADKKVVMISPTATSPDLTSNYQPGRDRWFFRTTPADDLQGKAVVLFALKGPPGATLGDGGVLDDGGDAGRPAGSFCTNLALVNIDNSYGNAMGDVIVSYLKNRGGTITTRAVVPVKRADNYKVQVDQVIKSSPQCQALIAYDDVGDQYMLDLTARASELPPGFIVIGTDGVYTQQFITNGRVDKSNPNLPTVAEGVYGTNPDTNPPTREFGDFKNLYNAYFPLPAGSQPGIYTANVYDAAILAILAIAQAGSVSDGVKIRDSLFDVSKKGTVFGPAQLAEALQAIRNGEDIDYKGASGNVDLDDFGNTVSDYIVWKVENGEFTETPVDRIRAAEVQ